MDLVFFLCVSAPTLGNEEGEPVIADRQIRIRDNPILLQAGEITRRCFWTAFWTAFLHAFIATALGIENETPAAISISCVWYRYRYREGERSCIVVTRSSMR